MNKAIGMAVALACAALALPASAQTASSPAASASARDGVYRGTIVCGSSLLLRGRPRSAVELTITGREARYSRPVIEKGVVLGNETGTGTLDGDKLALTGSWRGDALGFEAAYAGNFVRRASVKFTGSQTWTRDGKTTSRKCSGSAKRPPAFFRRKAG